MKIFYERLLDLIKEKLKNREEQSELKILDLGQISEVLEVASLKEETDSFEELLDQIGTDIEENCKKNF